MKKVKINIMKRNLKIKNSKVIMKIIQLKKRNSINY